MMIREIKMCKKCEQFDLAELFTSFIFKLKYTLMKKLSKKCKHFEFATRI